MNKFICSAPCQGSIIYMHVMADTIEEARRAFTVSLERLRWPGEARRETAVTAAPDETSGNRFYDWQHHGWHEFTS